MISGTHFLGRTIDVSISEPRLDPSMFGREGHQGIAGGRGYMGGGRGRSGYNTSGRDYQGRGGSQNARGGFDGISNSTVPENTVSGICNEWWNDKYKHDTPVHAAASLPPGKSSKGLLAAVVKVGAALQAFTATCRIDIRH